ncbi:glycosyltransferase family 2 protein [Pseudomonas sp. RTC3]|uniref:glycosyltransferase family 2 protein n=1 Tax=unclassified Pseudomonas TaxID=196821 RepID=UPI002AB5BF63|nr:MULTISPECIES: glycosyltransferase family 2 protein [unclassified Pseudomonas]MEB0064844.1 glycosyltransferase family 2 protein [Pseudomonas sp. RTC3]MDY7564750.1 glycosyltransferase family 2 protein [Pseudomonas sp. 5C2]MEB0008372.1 glycosyltransferase family 2 protein [Pseudomonas sp. RTB2]MEB0018037.1 glycosyltransferase family 2 protein [Pseudomonas sp. RTB3]MEB0243430.1 glycosyltransferase family 2 protein [Pseudomonas sp. 5C2]
MTCSLPTKANYSIVLVNYKSLELTKACLELLRDGLQETGVPIFVVDNYSDDASSEYLRTLNWINLIERKIYTPEAGNVAHGRALDLALDHVETEYLFLLHTDTFIYDPTIFTMMIDQCAGPYKVAAVGCLEQLNRGITRSAWRLFSRFFKHYTRRSFLAMGFKARAPKPFRETHLKSFCTLWNVRLIKQHGLHFQMDERNPGYELQDRMVELNYKISFIPPRKLFRYLDHIQSGTVSAMGGYANDHRRVKIYNQFTHKSLLTPHSPGLNIRWGSLQQK